MGPMRFVLAGALAIIALLIAREALASDISGAGATFPYPLYTKWATLYRAETGGGVNYQGVGSGAGIKLIQGNSVTFGATDMPLTLQELEASDLIQFPTVVGGDVAVVNVAGVKSGDLVLDGPTLAGIYLGKIKSWSDASIKRLNPTLSLPSTPINVVHRSDGSGTTFIWGSYLSKVSAEWLQGYGASTIIDWPIGLGANRNEGVAATVAGLPGSIGYVEYAFAKKRSLAFAKMVNQSGNIVSPSLESFRAAAEGVDWARAAGFYVILTNQRGPQAWPISGATFILMHKHPADASASNEALKFFRWAYEKGGPSAIELDYVPLPQNAIGAVEASWLQIQGLSLPK